ncbi:Dolichyl-phosphate beta-D-mannosyltransferase precursor conserved [Leptomonas seymouri]|uniref:Dolichol-phosphate mannosyltransferase subunit 1 n=1 Tax=Leptomonas seymouri TaxID=5684 RepID=A0A0N1HYX9_LEPSE|nr:Dolichyl-phosphate beta-D-mannosyltransferase precursor conserved [Leptomonas seymouri]|eukprot:KPI88223.1 Dolichyl-phosphate beta-D-mannosyltransferase precursor conserved [Leptomonas seymouri]
MQYSIVVPAYKESGNLEPLARRVFAAIKDQGFPLESVEMLIVDDNSRDGSVEVVRKLQEEGFSVRIDVRTTERGLSSAVIHGLRQTSGTYKIVMDADLQHPPESVPALFKALSRDGVQFVCGTRYGAGIEIDKNWPAHRRLISCGARILARPLTSLSDPMSGFFGIRDDVFKRHAGEVNPIGYKIALELFVKCHVQRFEEVGFNFATRTFGESKLTGKVIVNYLQHLHALYVYKLGPLFYVLLLVAALLALFVLSVFLRLIF